MKQPASLRMAFDLTTNLVSEGPSQNVTIDNFPGLVSMLEEYALIAGYAVEDAGQVDRRKTGESPLETSVKRGHKAVDTLFELKTFIDRFVNDSVSLSHGK